MPEVATERSPATLSPSTSTSDRLMVIEDQKLLPEG